MDTNQNLVCSPPYRLAYETEINEVNGKLEETEITSSET
jgi:hypothetical protein